MAQKLKIALVSQPYDGVRPPHQNSVGISVYELSRNLAPTHQVTVVTSHRAGSDEPALESGIRYHYLSVGPDLWLHRQIRESPGFSGMEKSTSPRGFFI